MLIQDSFYVPSGHRHTAEINRQENEYISARSHLQHNCLLKEAEQPPPSQKSVLPVACARYEVAEVSAMSYLARGQQAFCLWRSDLSLSLVNERLDWNCDEAT